MIEFEGKTIIEASADHNTLLGLSPEYPMTASKSIIGSGRSVDVRIGGSGMEEEEEEEEEKGGGGTAAAAAELSSTVSSKSVGRIDRSKSEESSGVGHASDFISPSLVSSRLSSKIREAAVVDAALIVAISASEIVREVRTGDASPTVPRKLCPLPMLRREDGLRLVGVLRFTGVD